MLVEEQQPQSAPEPQRALVLASVRKSFSSEGRAIYIVRARCPHCRRAEADSAPFAELPPKVLRDANCLHCGAHFDVLISSCFACQQRRVWFCPHVAAARERGQQTVKL